MILNYMFGSDNLYTSPPHVKFCKKKNHDSVCVTRQSQTSMGFEPINSSVQTIQTVTLNTELIIISFALTFSIELINFSSQKIIFNYILYMRHSNFNFLNMLELSQHVLTFVIHRCHLSFPDFYFFKKLIYIMGCFVVLHTISIIYTRKIAVFWIVTHF